MHREGALAECDAVVRCPGPLARGVFAGAILFGGCAVPVQVSSPPEPPALYEPSLAVPGDLDLVIRVDMARLGNTLGQERRTALANFLRPESPDAADAATSRLLAVLLARTDTAWIAARPGLSAEQTDNVLVLRGDFEGLLRSEIGGMPRWSSPRDLGAGVLKFTRSRPELRASPAVLYFRVPSLVVIGSYAEVDALEATLERGRGDPALEPPDTGIASLAARLDLLMTLIQGRAPTFSKLLRGGRTARASAEWVGDALDLRVELTFDSEERAQAIAQALESTARKLAAILRRPGSWISRGTFQAVTRSVVVRFVIPATELFPLLQGTQGSGGQSDGTVRPP